MREPWAVDGNDLNTRSRSGGAIAEKGFTFQRAYAVVRLTWLTMGQQGLVNVRYEGSQDVDLRFGSGSERFVQAKDYAQGNLTYAVLRDVLVSFARDVITAKARGRLTDDRPTFEVVATSVPEEAKAIQLLKGTEQAHHIAVIAQLIKDEHREGLSNAEVLECVRQAWMRTEFRFVSSEAAVAALKGQASWNLVQFGVPPDAVPQTLSRLLESLVPRSVFDISDVAESLYGLPDDHPASSKAACRLLPATKHLGKTNELHIAFLQGAARALWYGIANKLDVPRTEHAAITKSVRELTEHGGMLVVEGAAGTGKSALIRRIAWDAHRSGSHIVLEITAPGKMNEGCWKFVRSLLSLSERPVLLVVDDIWRHDAFVDDLDTYAAHGLCVLATSRPGERDAGNELPGLLCRRTRLGHLSYEVISGLQELIKASGGQVSKLPEGDLKRFASTGQLLALSLTLQSGSLSNFAASLLNPLPVGTAMHRDFLDVCVASSHDLTMPLSIFERSAALDQRFWMDSRYEGLASRESFGGLPRLRVGHALVAQAITDASGVNRVDRAIYLCAACSPAIVEERRFVIRLLKSTLDDPLLRNDARSKGKSIAMAAAHLLAEASYADAHRVSEILASVGQQDSAAVFTAVARPDRILDIFDIGLALSRQSRDEFASLYPVLLKFYNEHDGAAGRRRLLKAVLMRGSPDQQTELARLTAPWAIKNQYPIEETRMLLNLAGSASSNKAALELAPLVRAYLCFDQASVEVLQAACTSVYRTADIDLARALVSKGLKVLDSGRPWGRLHSAFARRLVFLSRVGIDHADRRALASMLLEMQGADTIKTRRIRSLRAAITVAVRENFEQIHQAIRDAAPRLGEQALKELQIQFERQHGPSAVLAIQSIGETDAAA